VEASEGFTGKTSYSEDEVALFLWQATVRENARSFAIRRRRSSEVIGILEALVPNPDDDVPWIGLLAVAANHQGTGVGREAVEAFEATLRTEGATRVRLNVMTSQPTARRFWESLGYAVTGEGRDSSGRPVWNMEKRLDPSR
jgi:RimJ/RimL family protein N-acetyltransferase